MFQLSFVGKHVVDYLLVTELCFASCYSYAVHILPILAQIRVKHRLWTPCMKKWGPLIPGPHGSAASARWLYANDDSAGAIGYSRMWNFHRVVLFFDYVIRCLQYVDAVVGLAWSADTMQVKQNVALAVGSVVFLWHCCWASELSKDMQLIRTSNKEADMDSWMDVRRRRSVQLIGCQSHVPAGDSCLALDRQVYLVYLPQCACADSSCLVRVEQNYANLD